MGETITIFLTLSGALIIGVCIYLWMHFYKKGDPNISKRVDKLQQEKYDPNMNRFAARKEAKASAARAELAVQVGDESRVVADMVEQQKEVLDNQFALKFAPARKIEERELEQAQAGNRMNTIKAADKEDMDYATYNQFKLEEKLSELRVTEHEKKEKINLDNKLTEKQESLRLALIAKHLSDIQKIALVQEQIDMVYKQIGKIDNEAEFSDRIKQRMIEDREEIIKTLKEERREREAGLLATHTRRELRGDNEDASLR